MTSPDPDREATSLAQLASVSHARQVRLQTERQALAERERVMAQQWAAQASDEALLAEQKLSWSAAWKQWSAEGGALRDAMSLRRDKELLADMASLLLGRRKQLQEVADKLAQDLRDWVRRQRSADALAESLDGRKRALNVSLDRAAERQRDEETLMTRAAVRVAAPPSSPQGWAA